MSEQSPLSDDLLDLLDAEREPELVPPATRERMFARLAPLLVPPGGGGGIGGTPSGQTGAASGGAGGAAAAAGAGWTAKLILSAVSLVVGVGGGAAGHAWLASSKPVPVVVAASSSEPVAAAPSASSEAEPPAAEPAPSASATSSPRSDDHRGAASLTAERLLLETATAALLRGDNASAIATLRKHAHQFPKGELAQEREALLVQALAASGDDAAAQKHAKDFKKKFPGSLQQGAVDKASSPR